MSARWIIGYGEQPPSCFPEGFDTRDLVNVTRLGDSWARFFNPNTGEVIDCAEFARQMQSTIDLATKKET